MKPKHELSLNQCGQLVCSERVVKQRPGCSLPTYPPFPAKWMLLWCETQHNQNWCGKHCQYQFWAFSSAPSCAPSAASPRFLNPPWAPEGCRSIKQVPAPLKNHCPLPDGCISLCPLPVPATSRVLPQGPFLSCAQLVSLVCISLLESNVYACHTRCQLARNINVLMAEQQSLPKDPLYCSAQAPPFLPSWDPC